MYNHIEFLSTYYHTTPTPHIKFRGGQFKCWIITPDTFHPVLKRLENKWTKGVLVREGEGSPGEIVIDPEGRLWFVNWYMELYRLTTNTNDDVVMGPTSSRTGSGYTYAPFLMTDSGMKYRGGRVDKAGGWANRRVIGVRLEGGPEWYMAMMLEAEWGGGYELPRQSS